MVVITLSETLVEAINGEMKGATMSETKDIKTKFELMDSLVQIAIAKGYSDYDCKAVRFINETVKMYINLPPR